MPGSGTGKKFKLIISDQDSKSGTIDGNFKKDGGDFLFKLYHTVL